MWRIAKEPCTGPSVGPIMTILVLGNENDVSTFQVTRGGRKKRWEQEKQRRGFQESRIKHWNASARMIIGKTTIAISIIVRIGANKDRTIISVGQEV